MKKLNSCLLLGLLTFLSFSTYSQKISTDRLMEENVRQITTENLIIEIDKATYEVSLTLISSLNSDRYFLMFSSIWQMEENGVVMIKLGNGEIIKLEADFVKKEQIDYPTYGTGTEKIDKYYSIFEVNNEILQKIVEYGINKIRISTFANTYNEQNWKKDVLGKYIKNSLLKIQSQLQKPCETLKTIEEGF